MLESATRPYEIKSLEIPGYCIHVDRTKRRQTLKVLYRTDSAIQQIHHVPAAPVRISTSRWRDVSNHQSNPVFRHYGGPRFIPTPEAKASSISFEQVTFL